MQGKGFSLMKNHYGRSLYKALATIYPEHQWDVRNFKRAPRGHWKDQTNQKKFFVELESSLSILILLCSL
jgi:hypothetical protein